MFGKSTGVNQRFSIRKWQLLMLQITMNINGGNKSLLAAFFKIWAKYAPKSTKSLWKWPRNTWSRSLWMIKWSPRMMRTKPSMSEGNKGSSHKEWSLRPSRGNWIVWDCSSINLTLKSNWSTQPNHGYSTNQRNIMIEQIQRFLLLIKKSRQILGLKVSYQKWIKNILLYLSLIHSSSLNSKWTLYMLFTNKFP